MERPERAGGIPHDSKRVAEAFMRRQATGALQEMVAFLLTDKPTKEQILSVRRARRNAELIRKAKV